MTIAKVSSRSLAAIASATLTVGLSLSLAPGALARTAVPGVSFGRAFKLSPPLNSEKIPYAFLRAVSCSSFAGCGAGGQYEDRNFDFQAMAITEQAGRWGRGVRLRLPANAPANPQARVQDIACPRSGFCTAFGSYAPNGFYLRLFAASQTGGRWARGVQLKLPANAASDAAGQPETISCPATGTCLATGYYMDKNGDNQAMLIAETNGRWHQASEIFPPLDAAAHPYAELTAVDCRPGGQCVIAGSYTDSTGHRVGLGIVESNGSFPTVQTIKFPSNSTGKFNEINSVSCVGSSRCVIVGGYKLKDGQIEPLSFAESGGKFSAMTELKVPAPNVRTAILYSVGCTPTGQCVGVGTYFTDANVAHAFSAVRSASGHWSGFAILRDPPGTGTAPSEGGYLYGVSCVRRGCMAVGTYTASDGSTNAMAAFRP